jgi:hypothetical protein
MALLKDMPAHSKETSERLEIAKQWPTARELMRMTPEERKPFLRLSVDCALTRYQSDQSRPESERILTADLETGDFYDALDTVHA